MAGMEITTKDSDVDGIVHIIARVGTISYNW